MNSILNKRKFQFSLLRFKSLLLCMFFGIALSMHGQVDCSNDTAPPECEIASPVLLELDTAGMATLTLDDVSSSLSIFDDCMTDTSIVEMLTFDCDSEEAQFTVLVTDESGNTGTCTATVEPVDNQIPTFTILKDTFYLDDQGMFVINATDVMEAEDNCAIEDILLMRASGIDMTTIDTVTCDDIDLVSYMFTVSDENGNSATNILVDVIVQDTLAPQCMDSTIVVDLMPEECETVVTFDLPLATDNCDDAPVSSPNIGQPASGEMFSTGVTEVLYTATDENGNSNEACLLNIEVRGFEASVMGCRNINLSLDETCLATVTPLMVLTEGEYGCLEDCIIEITDPHGHIVDTIRNTEVNKLLEYKITCGFNSCWGNILVEDKMPPMITVENDTIDCAAGPDSAVEAMTIVDNCSNSVPVVIGELFEKIDCDENFVGKYTRYWQATDKSGNKSNIDTQMIFVRRLDLSDVVFPMHLMNSKSLECNTFNYDENGAVPVSLTDVPRINGVPIFPFENSGLCSGFVTFNDETILDTPCKKIIQRTWQVGEWYCGGSPLREFPQLISIKDTRAPFLTSPLPTNVLEFSTTGHECEGRAEMPVAQLSDLCNGIRSVRMSWSSGVKNTNGGFIDLPIGRDTVTYTFTDDCGNQSTRDVYVNVKDNRPPTSVCDEFTTVSLKNDGKAYVIPEMIDDGSYDDCSDVTFRIRRMFDNCSLNGTAWNDTIYFCCADAGAEHQVVLEVRDAGGNTNFCMAFVEVQDKVTPTLTCPIDMTVNCTRVFDEMNLNSVFDAPIITGNCVDAYPVMNTIDDRRSTCNTGKLFRTISLLTLDEETVISQCQQEITFINDEPFNESDIMWPARELTVTACIEDDLSTDVTGVPTWSSDQCELIASRFEDQEFLFTGAEDACRKVLRTWTIIDWCQQDEFGNYLEFTYEQTILAIDTIDPVITELPETEEYCSYSADCDDFQVVDQIAQGTDNCSVPLGFLWTVRVYDEDDNLVRTNNTNNANGIYAVGSYRVEWVLEDRCGNEDFEETFFEIKNCKQPTAYCIKGLSTSIGLMDLDGDGTGDAVQAMLTPDFFDAGSSPACVDPFTLSFSEDLTDTLLTVTCEDLGVYLVRLYVTDMNGAQSFCETELLVDDNSELCGTRISGDISGRIVTDKEEGIDKVEVKLEADELKIAMSDEEDGYKFAGLPLHRPYLIEPEKDGNDMDGVSTLDLILIQRHILQMTPLSNPYDMIAADVNRDDKVTASDLSELRKLVLGIYSELPNNTSWRFIDASYTFPDPTNPWVSVFPEDYFINDLTQNMLVDFVGTKVGDVNGSVMDDLKGFVTAPRTTSNWSGEVIADGDDHHIIVAPEFETMVTGTQITIENLRGEVLSVTSEIVDASDLYYYQTGDKVTILFTAPDGLKLMSDATVFDVLVDAPLEKGQELEMSNGEVYNEDLSASNINMTWRGEEIVGNVFAVEQNKPNPWSSATNIDISLPESGKVVTTIFDVTGRKVFTKLYNFSKGKNTIRILEGDLDDKGVFIYEIKYKDEVIRKKMINI